MSVLSREQIEQLGRAVASHLAANQVTDWIDQYRSPLRMPGQKSSKRHCLLVRQRIARLGADAGAYISPDEKQFFMTPQALADELRRYGQEDLARRAPLAKAEPVATEEPESEEGSRVLRILGLR